MQRWLAARYSLDQVQQPWTLPASLPLEQEEKSLCSGINCGGRLWLLIPHCRFFLMPNWEEEFSLFSLLPGEARHKKQTNKKKQQKKALLWVSFCFFSFFFFFLFLRFSWNQEDFLTHLALHWCLPVASLQSQQSFSKTKSFYLFSYGSSLLWSIKKWNCRKAFSSSTLCLFFIYI